MTSAFTSIAHDDLTLFTRGDEPALERIFRSEYDALLGSVSAELDDAAAAPRIVEGAFYEAWRKRADFAQPGDLALFLREAVHREALRERGRRAALHRFQEHEGAAHAHGGQPQQPAQPVSASEAWAALAAALHAPQERRAELDERRHDASRHGAAAHVAKVAAPKSDIRGVLLMMVVAAAVIGGIFGVMRLLGAGDPGGRVDAELARGEARVVSTRPAQRANVPLADGSRASLAPDTQLRIAKEYARQLRVVGLVGAATFSVAESDKPFFVRAGAARVRATGTVFDVSTFGESGTIIRVREGSVAVTSADSTHDLAAGDALAVGADSSMSTPTAAALDEAVGWTDGDFVLVDRPMRDVPAQLLRWYGLQIAVADSALLDRRVSVRVPLDSTRLMISTLEQAARARYTYKGEARFFRDADARP